MFNFFKNPKIMILSLFFLILLPLALWGYYRAVTLESAALVYPKSPQRIISLAPSITETLFALNLNDKIVGVTRFCLYPQEAQKKPQIAGFSDVNYEAILRQKPDLVIVPEDKVNAIKALKRMGLPVATVDNRSLSGLQNSIYKLGELTGKTNKAQALIDNLADSLKKAAEKNEDNIKEKPTVLFAVMRSYEGLGDINQLQIIGRDGFYDELINLAGGKNIYQGKLAYPKISAEGIIRLNPDIIIDIIAPGEDTKKAGQDWEKFSNLKAIKNNKLIIINTEGATVPGPRFPEILELLSFLIHS